MKSYQDLYQQAKNKINKLQQKNTKLQSQIRQRCQSYLLHTKKYKFDKHQNNHNEAQISIVNVLNQKIYPNSIIQSSNSQKHTHISIYETPTKNKNSILTSTNSKTSQKQYSPSNQQCSNCIINDNIIKGLKQRLAVYQTNKNQLIKQKKILQQNNKKTQKQLQKYKSQQKKLTYSQKSKSYQNKNSTQHQTNNQQQYQFELQNMQLKQKNIQLLQQITQIHLRCQTLQKNLQTITIELTNKTTKILEYKQKLFEFQQQQHNTTRQTTNKQIEQQQAIKKYKQKMNELEQQVNLLKEQLVSNEKHFNYITDQQNNDKIQLVSQLKLNIKQLEIQCIHLREQLVQEKFHKQSLQTQIQNNYNDINPQATSIMIEQQLTNDLKNEYVKRRFLRKRCTVKKNKQITNGINNIENKQLHKNSIQQTKQTSI